MKKKIGISFETLIELIKMYAYYTDHVGKKPNKLFYKLFNIFNDKAYKEFPFKNTFLIKFRMVAPNYLGMYKKLIKKVMSSTITNKEYKTIEKEFVNNKMARTFLDSAYIVWNILLQQTNSDSDTHQIITYIKY